MDTRTEEGLIEALEQIPKKAGVTARALIAAHRQRLVELAEYHCRCVEQHETWQDATEQWGKVANNAAGLIEALSGLGVLACAIRLDTAVKDMGLYQAVSEFLPVAPGAMPVCALYDLKSFAKKARTESVLMQSQCNGAERRTMSAPLFLLEQVRWLCPDPIPKAHVVRIVETIHDWATGGHPRLSARWEERAWREIRAQRPTQTPG